VVTPGDGTSVDLVNGGAATVTFSNSDGSPATISVPTDALLKPAPLPPE
jgi:hypothetical protein